jgi:hypothetical protein
MKAKHLLLPYAVAKDFGRTSNEAGFLQVYFPTLIISDYGLSSSFPFLSTSRQTFLVLRI